ATQSPPGLLIHTVISPEPAISSSLKSCGVTSSSNQLSSAIVPFRNSVLASGIVSVCAWFFHFQNFFIGVFLLSVIVGCICKSTRIFQWEHIAVDKVQVAAFFRRDTVEVFQFTDIVRTHPTVLATNGVAVHTALVIATEQTLKIEFHKITHLFIVG